MPYYPGGPPPPQLTDSERKSLDALNSLSSSGSMRMGIAAQRQFEQLRAKEQQSQAYSTFERNRLANEQRLAAQEQTKQAQKAAQQQIDAANLMQQTYTKQHEQVREDLGPWRQAGAEAMTDYSKAVKAGPGEYTQSPGYQARLEEGQKAISNRASMHGNVLSGATMKAAARFGQDYATQDYDNFLNRYYKSLEPKKDIAQIGQASAAQVGAQGLQTANLMGQSQQYSGEAAAGGTMNAANIMAAQKAAASDRDYAYTAWRTGREF